MRDDINIKAFRTFLWFAAFEELFLRATRGATTAPRYNGPSFLDREIR
jgi:hypothetical protein